VLDEEGALESMCNLTMVDLEPIEADQEAMEKLTNGQTGDLENHGLVEIMSDISKRDAERLYRLIARHGHYTNSAKAKHILANWQAFLPKFKKVMPIEYRRALAEIARAQAADTTGLEVLEIGLKIADAGNN
jgi:glutamate synthase (NADPH/NADH) large chain